MSSRSRRLDARRREPAERYTFALTGRAAAAGRPGRRGVAGAGRRDGRGPDDRRRSRAERRPGGAADGGARLPTGAALAELAPRRSRRGTAISARTSRTPRSSSASALLLKAYRRLQPGLNPDLEMTAFLSEEAGFPAVPPLAGFAEVVIGARRHDDRRDAQEFVADGADAYESIAEALDGLAPGAGRGQPRVRDRGRRRPRHADRRAARRARRRPRSAGVGAARGDRATSVRGWATAAHEHLASAPWRSRRARPARIVRDLAPRIAEALTRHRRPADGARGHPGPRRLPPRPGPGRARRLPDHRLRGRAAAARPRSARASIRRCATSRRCSARSTTSARSAGGGPRRGTAARSSRPGLDLEAWLRASRERFLEAYRAGLLRAARADRRRPDLLRAFEVDKELYEFVYAATYLPAWLWAPTEGMRALFEERA